MNMKTILENISDVVVETSEHGVISFINPSCRSVLGYAEDSLIGRNICDFLHENDVLMISNGLNEAFEAKLDSRVEFRFKHAHGHYLWLESSFEHLLDVKGDLIGFIFFIRNVKDEKKVNSKLSKFLSLSSDLIGIANTEGYFVEVNNAFKIILGWDAAEILSKPYLDFVHPEDREATNKVASELAEGVRIDSFLNRYICKDGTYKWLSWNILLESDEALIYFSARDLNQQIIDKEKYKREILRNEEFHASTIDNIQGVVYHCKNDEKWTMQYLSKGCYALTGYTSEELINNSKEYFGNLVLAKYRLKLMPLSNAKYEHEYEIRTKNKEIKWVLDRGKTIYSENGQAVRQEGILTDITEIKMIERDLKDTKDKLQLVAENISEVIWLRSADDSKIIFVNSAFEDIWGIPCSKLYENPMIFMNTIYEDDSERVKEAFKQYETSGYFDMSYRIRRLDGNIRWIHAKSKVVKNKDGEVIGRVGSAKDITYLMVKEEALERAVSKLYEKDQYLNSIMETQEEMICRFLPDTTLTFVNKAYCKLLKRSEDQLIGRKFLELIPETEHKDIMDKLGDLSLHNPSVSYKQKIFVEDNNEIWKEWTDTAIFNSENELIEYQGVGRDITAIVLANQKKESSLELLQKTQKIAGVGSYEVDLLNDTCKSSQYLNELLGIDSNEMHPLGLWPELIRDEDRERVLRAHNKSVFQGCDFDEEYRIIRKNDKVEIWVHDIGEIEFGSDGKPSKLTGTMMDVTKRKAFTKKLNSLNQELAEAYDSTIQGWAYALEMKEEETKEHSLRVTELTLSIAKKLNISDDENLIHIKRGAILHDIGKMAIPDAILLKPDKLDANEWRIMKKHPEYAYEMLSDIAYLQPALDIPYCHHEKWDGTGYPRALKGEEIPIQARIFAVVDVFDALTSDRPYKKAWSTDEALSYIDDNRGIHFDPKVVDAFREVLEGVYIEKKNNEAIH